MPVDYFVQFEEDQLNNTEHIPCSNTSAYSLIYQTNKIVQLMDGINLLRNQKFNFKFIFSSPNNWRELFQIFEITE